MPTIDQDGTLTKDEALKALRIALEAATDALPEMLKKCTTDDQRKQCMGDRDKILLAYLSALDESLVHTGAMFEKVANDLEDEAATVQKKRATLKNAADAIGLLADLVGLAASLALAFA